MCPVLLVVVVAIVQPYGSAHALYLYSYIGGYRGLPGTKHHDLLLLLLQGRQTQSQLGFGSFDMAIGHTHSVSADRLVVILSFIDTWRRHDDHQAQEANTGTSDHRCASCHPSIICKRFWTGAPR